jgi:RNA ligase (TIGR02306 family)
MTDFHVEVVRIGPVTKHPNADTLSMTLVGGEGGYPVLFKTGEFNEGDLAVYIPVDAIVPNTQEWAWLGGKTRIKAKRLRGVFSMGLLIPVPESLKEYLMEGTDAAEALNITKRDESEDVFLDLGARARMAAPDVNDPGGVPKYDIEPLRKFGYLFQEGELVYVTEKIHGTNFRAVYRDGRLHVGSRNRFLLDGDNVWWNVARKYDLEKKLSQLPGLVLYGEVYGPIQDLRYGVPDDSTDPLFVAFDFYEKDGSGAGPFWYDPELFYRMCAALGIPPVPLLYAGPYRKDLKDMAEGRTVLHGATHVREGIVIKPARDREEPGFGRVFLKLAGEGYLTRKTA